MNSYEIIKSGINNGSSDSQIIDALQTEFPESQVENNIFIIEETKSLLEPPPKRTPTELKSNYFIVKKNKEYIDINTGRTFKPFTKIPYSKCQEGLCEKVNSLVLKNIVKNSYIPNVFIAVDETLRKYKSIKIEYKNNNKKQQVWEFTSQEINACIEGLNEGLEKGLNDKQLYKYLAIKLFCPRETIPLLIKYININQKSRSRYGSNKGKNKTRMDSRRTGRKTRR